jgi:TRAP-type C4-dicarboxylate transport system substrate-binding protein
MKTLAGATICLFIFGLTFFAGSIESEAKTIILKFAHPWSPKHAQQTQLFEPWAKTIEEQTNGQVKIKIFPGGALGKPGQIYSMVEKGLADIGHDLHDYTPGRFPITSVFELPFMIKTAEHGSEAIWQAYEKIPALQKEYQGVKLLWMSCHAPGFFNTTEKPIKSLSDLKGLKIRTASSIVTDALQLFGATPVTMPGTEIYTALEKGVVDGTVLPYDGLNAFKLHDLVKHITRTDFYSMTFWVAMNQKKFDSLPKDVQKVINANMGIEMSKASGKIFDADSVVARKKFLANGLNEYIFSDEEMTKLKQIILPLKEKWVNEMAAEGIESKEILRIATKLCKKNKLQSNLSK